MEIIKSGYNILNEINPGIHSLGYHCEEEVDSSAKIITLVSNFD